MITRALTKFEKMQLVLQDKLVIGSGILGVLLFIAAPFLNILFLPAFLLVFNAFDLLGYRNVLRAELYEDPTNKCTPSYRIMQTMFEISLLTIIALTSNIYVAAAVKLSHWFGAQDVLYYLIGKYRIEGIFTWLKWTPLGICKGWLTPKEVELQALTGVILSAILILWLGA